MTVQVNGDPRDVTDGATVQQLLETLGVNPLLVAVELNLEILTRDRYPTMGLREGDVVEVVQIVGGGA